MIRKLVSVSFLTAFCLTLPELAQASARSTVTFRDAVGFDRIYHFASGNNGHLVVNYWDGYTWHWADQGLPPGVTYVVAPSAITFKDFVGNQWIYVFALGGYPYKLVVNYWDGSQWHWANQGGNLSFTTVGGVFDVGPTPITFVDSSSHRRIYVFAIRSDGHLAVNYWNGFVWQWADQGLPAGAHYMLPLDAVTYSDGGQRIYVFGIAQEGKLFVNYWDGSGWHWLNLEGAGGSGGVVRASAITYFDGCEGRGCEGQQRIYLFSTGLDYTGSLWATYWDGNGWHSADLGKPPGIPGLDGNVSAITYVDNSGTRRINVFVSQSVFGVQGGDVLGMYLKHLDGSGWHWADRGIPLLPPGASLNAKLDAISFVNSHGYRWIHAFCLLTESDNQHTAHLVRNSQVFGSPASWAYQGVLP